MAKNKSFKNTYQITVSGTCTNGFTAKLIHRMMIMWARALQITYDKQTIELEVIETKGDFDAKNTVDE